MSGWCAKQVLSKPSAPPAGPPPPRDPAETRPHAARPANKASKKSTNLSRRLPLSRLQPLHPSPTSRRRLSTPLSSPPGASLLAALLPVAPPLAARCQLPPSVQSPSAHTHCDGCSTSGRLALHIAREKCCSTYTPHLGGHILQRYPPALLSSVSCTPPPPKFLDRNVSRGGPCRQLTPMLAQ